MPYLTAHYPSPTGDTHRNCPECAKAICLEMLHSQRRRAVPTMTRAQRNATRFRPMGMR